MPRPSREGATTARPPPPRERESVSLSTNKVLRQAWSQRNTRAENTCRDNRREIYEMPTRALAKCPDFRKNTVPAKTPTASDLSVLDVRRRIGKSFQGRRRPLRAVDPRSRLIRMSDCSSRKSFPLALKATTATTAERRHVTLNPLLRMSQPPKVSFKHARVAAVSPYYSQPFASHLLFHSLAPREDLHLPGANPTNLNPRL